MSRPRCLDLYCGAGGSAKGLQMAGFHVTGVDIKPQPHYCGDDFYQADALTFPLEGYDCYWASPPCQGFTDLRHMPNSKHHENLIGATRERLVATGLPYIMENVEGAPLIFPIVLCGTMFGLGVLASNAELWRHRLFEMNWTQPLTPKCNHRFRPRVIGVYGGHGRDRRRVITVVGHSGGRIIRDGCQQFSVADRREAMGIDWMTGAELSQAIPPAYSEYLGKQMMQAVLATKGAA